MLSRAEPKAAVDGDTQLSASFPEASDVLAFELSDDRRRAVFSIELPNARLGDDARISACARARQLNSGGTELQFWVWRGFAPLVAERATVEFSATEVRIAGRCGEPGDVSVWSPEWMSLEPPGDAYAHLAELPSSGEMSDADRREEGRQIVVEMAGDLSVDVDAWSRLGSGRNRFLIRQAAGHDLAALDREWLAARLHGVALDGSRLSGDESRNLLLWAGWRQSLLYIGGADWESIYAVVKRRQAEMVGPVVLTDPAFSAGAQVQPLPSEIAALAVDSDRIFVLLACDSMECSNQADIALLSDRLLLAGPRAEEVPQSREATENLRYLTERTLLARLRQAGGHPPVEVGRRQVAS
jgi:hypothetical protein